MKLKVPVLLITILLGLIVLSGHVRAASSDPEAVFPNRVSKKELASIEKKYPNVWNHIKYYRATRPVHIRVKFKDKQNTDNYYKKQITIPRNTIVNGDKSIVYYSRNKANAEFTFDASTFSYKMLKPVLTSQMVQPDAKLSAKKMSSINKYFVRVKRPSFMPAYSTGALNKYLGDHVKFSPFFPSTNRLKLTPDGYIEYARPNSNAQYTYQLFNLVPNAYVKIQKFRVKNSTRYLYYSHHLNGVSDRRVATSGRAQYRLTVKNLHRPFTMFDGDQGALLMSQYRIGKTTYYTRSGSFSA